ncbi:hypothetical protein [Microvirga aerophila]|uniref:DUF3024 domain-containing protein n=1 Tax=Microvirga aerophila TaxID=670291 RepID=UPI001FDF192D|nr:hypothetical protein [Microvirga aerophila]
MAITTACERLLAEVLRPRFLPAIRPTSFSYPVAITGKWHSNKYRFLQRFRSDDPDALEPKFDAPFASLGYVDRDCFDVSWHRHTEEWFCLYRSVSLTEALRLIESDRYPHPV